MKITFDPVKRAATLEHRGLDMADAAMIFAGNTLTTQDDRQDGGNGVDGAERNAPHHQLAQGE
ncbi:hypothetical protein [Aestuariivirga sp.]|uniref:hypothetical protein n=1 Tax=Aestuariivirga sp. TaxID=2650926 RepID=UPI0039E395BC